MWRRAGTVRTMVAVVGGVTAPVVGTGAAFAVAGIGVDVFDVVTLNDNSGDPAACDRWLLESYSRQAAG